MSDRFCSNCNAELHEGELGHYMAPSMGDGGIWACEAFQKVVGEGLTPDMDERPKDYGIPIHREVTPPSPEPPTQLEEIRAAAKSGDWATVIQLFRRKRTDDYRSGYSCGYSDAKNGKPMRDADAASIFYGEPISHLRTVRKASEEVATWPEWKKNVTISRDKPTATEPAVSQGQAQTPTRPACTCNLFRGEHFSWCRPEERILTGVCAYCGAPYVHAQVEGQAEPPSHGLECVDGGFRCLCGVTTNLLDWSNGYRWFSAHLLEIVARVSPTAAIDPFDDPKIKNILDRCEAGVVSFSNDDVSELLVRLKQGGTQSQVGERLEEEKPE